MKLLISNEVAKFPKILKVEIKRIDKFESIWMNNYMSLKSKSKVTFALARGGTYINMNKNT